MAFVHANPDAIPTGKTDKNEQAGAKLNVFREEVMRAHPVRTWSTASELGGLVSRSLVREIKVSPRPGWIRNDGSSPVALLEQISRLTDENRSLREQVHIEDELDTDLESGEDAVEISGTRRIRSLLNYSYQVDHWTLETTWDDLFQDIGPALINETTEGELRKILGRFSYLVEMPKDMEHSNVADLHLESWNEILVQFRALGLITQGIKKRGVNDKASYWGITPRGDRHLISLLARRKSDAQSDNDTSSAA